MRLAVSCIWMRKRDEETRKSLKSAVFFSLSVRACVCLQRKKRHQIETLFRIEVEENVFAPVSSSIVRSIHLCRMAQIYSFWQWNDNSSPYSHSPQSFCLQFSLFCGHCGCFFFMFLFLVFHFCNWKWSTGVSQIEGWTTIEIHC